MFKNTIEQIERFLQVERLLLFQRQHVKKLGLMREFMSLISFSERPKLTRYFLGQNQAHPRPTFS